MDILKIIIMLSYLIGLALLVGFSWLYLSRTSRAVNEIGLHAPHYLSLMIKISMGIAMSTAFFIALFLLLKIY